MRSLVLPLVCGAIALAQTTPQAKTFAPSDELNAQLPKWLRFNGEYRARVEGFGGGNFREGNDDFSLPQPLPVEYECRTHHLVAISVSRPGCSGFR